MEKTQEQKDYEQSIAMSFANLRKNIVQDLIKNRSESVIYSKYDKKSVVSMLENPQRNAKGLVEMSNFLYIVSSHYRRLINYYSKLPKFNYIIAPVNVPDKISKREYVKQYKEICLWAEKCNLNHECIKILQEVFRSGVFFGLRYESEDSFYIRPFDRKYCEISSIEDGCFRYKINLDYFNNKIDFLSEYGDEFILAYAKYKGNKTLGIKGSASNKWFEPSNGICVKMDEDDQIYSLPPFTGLLLSILDIEDYKLLKKAKTEIENYKVLAMKMDVDDDGVPKMDFGIAQQYYNQAAANIPEGIGLILSPFAIDDFSFQSSSKSESDAVRESEEDFWFTSGTSPMLFGSSKATTSSSLGLSIKPDESIVFSVLRQIERNLNMIIKKKDMSCLFAIKFLEQSIFNEKEVQDTYFKGASYGVGGSKILYAASLGMTPNSMNNLSYLEDNILKLTKEKWTNPLVSANVQSGNQQSEGGAPTNEERGVQDAESTENTRGNNQNDNK